MFKKKHECDYFVVAVDHDTVTFKNDKGELFQRKQTYLIWRCVCGDIDNQIVHGHFPFSVFAVGEAKGEGK